MPTKKFQAETMMEVLEMVQKELGSDAIVLSSREIPIGPSWQVWRKPGIEVIAMAPDKKSKTKSPASPTPRTQESQNQVVKQGKNGGVEWAEDRPQIEWDAGEVKTEPGPTKRVSPYFQPQQQPTPTQTQTVKRSTELENNFIQRQKAAVNSSVIKREPSVVLPAEKPAVSAVPGRQLDTIVEQDVQVETKQDTKRIPAGLAQIKQQLIAQGVDLGLVERLVQTTLTAFSPIVLTDERRSKTLMRKQLEAGLKVEDRFLSTLPGNVVCLVGASGSGKTTTVSKLAVHFSKSMGKKVIWICADTVRAGAIAETKAYADAIGVPLKLAYTPEDLTFLIQSNQDADVLLVDTPGYNPCDEEQMLELGVMLTQIPEDSTYLVAPATTKEADLLQAVSSLGLFKIRGLIITKMDETYSFGSVYNFVYQSQLPMVLFSYGKQILGDLQQADAGKVVSALFGKGWE